MGVNSLPKTVTRQRHGCDLNPGPSAPESSTLTTRLPTTEYSYREEVAKISGMTLYTLLDLYLRFCILDVVLM